MPAFLYNRTTKEGKQYLNQVIKISLGGFGAIHSFWTKKGKPIDTGWYITSSELIEYALKNQVDVKDYEIIIEAAPSVKSLVSLVRVIDINVYTHGDKNGGASWSNLLIRVKDLYWEKDITPAEKTSLTKCVQEPSEYGEDILTFLYLHGDERSWLFGRVGQMNGAWLHSEARGYFRQFF